MSVLTLCQISGGLMEQTGLCNTQDYYIKSDNFSSMSTQFIISSSIKRVTLDIIAMIPGNVDLHSLTKYLVWGKVSGSDSICPHKGAPIFVWVDLSRWPWWYKVFRFFLHGIRVWISLQRGLLAPPPLPCFLIARVKNLSTFAYTANQSLNGATGL